jgi:glycosyltransferase involved in cell wall biosynthesis
LRQILFSVVVLVWFLPALGQIDNRIITDSRTISKADSQTIGLHIEAMPYMRNTEYFNDIELGRTLFGYQLQPSVYIKPSHQYHLLVGVFARNDFGGKTAFTTVLPTFTLQLNIGQHNRFLFGTLEGALSHRLIEPLFDINAAIERRIENGFQFKREHEKGFYDVWINWEQFIERKDPFKERFTTGFNLAPRLLHTSNHTEIFVSTQFTAHHKGGQIDSDTGNMEMVLNGAAGFLAKRKLAGAIKYVEGNIYWVGFAEQTQSGNYAYRNGYGIFANLSARIADLTFMLSYWNAQQFIAPRGTLIYQSVSIDKPELLMKNRELLFFRVLYQKKISEHLYVDARFEPLYDPIAAQLDYSYSVYFTYRHTFGVGRIRE